MGNEKNIFRLAKIIVKSFREELLAEEQEILDHWLQEKEVNSQLYRRYAEEDFLKQKSQEAANIDWQQDYQNFLRKHEIKQQRVLNREWIRYAAIIFILFTVGSLFWLQPTNQPEEEIVIPTKTMQHPQVMLTLAGGKSIAVSDSTQLEEIDGTVVSGQTGQLTYKTEKTTEPEELIYHKLEIPRGAEYLLTLADGSQVWLNSESMIHYPVQFNSEKREVYIEGEAFFKVAHDTVHPFVVHTGNTRIEVLGTEFNVRNYLDEMEIATTLVKGSVRLISEKNNQEIILKPNEQGNIDKENGNLTSQKVNVYLYTAWKDARFVFRNTRMEDLLTILARWYDLEIFYQNNIVKDICFTGDMPRMANFQQLLNIIESNERVSFIIKDRTITVLQR